jgi:hypothetical protein
MPLNHPTPENEQAETLEKSPFPPAAPREIFILRLRRGEQGGEAAWQGEVQHVGSGRMIAVGKLADLLEALQELLNTLPPARRGLR